MASTLNEHARAVNPHPDPLPECRAREKSGRTFHHRVSDSRNGGYRVSALDGRGRPRHGGLTAGAQPIRSLLNSESETRLRSTRSGW